MKRLLIFLFVVNELICQGQSKIGMSTVFSFTPAGITTPSNTVTHSTSVTMQTYVKNTGNSVFSGVVHVIAELDTSGVLLSVIDSVVVSTSSLAPNDSIAAVITFTPTSGPNGFKSNGNGNVIVVWPKIMSGSGTMGDSIKTVLWINDTIASSVFEFENNTVKIYPNPLTDYLTIKSTTPTNYKKISIYDVFARKMKEMTFKEMIDISDLNSGFYWLIISSENKSYRINFIKE